MKLKFKKVYKSVMAVILAVVIFASSLPLIIMASDTADEDDEHEGTIYCYVCVNKFGKNEWQLVEKVTTHNWTEKSEGYFNPVNKDFTGRFYLTSDELGEIYKQYGFDASTFKGERIFPHTDYNDTGRIWADTEPKYVESRGTYYIPVSSRHTSYIYYAPNNISGNSAYTTSSVGTYNQDFMKANTFYTVQITDANKLVQEQYIEQTYNVLTGTSKDIELPYVDGVEYIVYNKDDNKVNCTQTVDEENKTVTISISNISQNLFIRTHKDGVEDAGRVTCYVSIDDKWVELNTIVTNKKSTKWSSGKARYYVTSDELDSIYSTFGFDSSQYNGDILFPHTDTWGPTTIWGDTAPIKDADNDNLYDIPVSNRLQSYLYYTPAGIYDDSNKLSTSADISNELTLKNNSFYTISVSDPKFLMPEDSIPEQIYKIHGSSYSVTLPIFSEDGYYSIINDNTKEYLTPTEIKDEANKTVTYIFDSVECPILITAGDGTPTVLYKATLQGQIKGFGEFYEGLQTISKDGKINKSKEYYDDLSSSGSYTVLSPDSDVAEVTLGGYNSKNRKFLYSFKGWKIGNSDVILQPGDTIPVTELKDYADSEHITTLTAVWKHTDTNNRATTANFYLNLDCEIMDTENNGFQSQHEDLFTEAVFQTRVLNTDNIPSSLGNRFKILAPPDEFESAYEVDEALRNTHSSPLDYGVTLDNFPSDEEIFENVRKTSPKFTVDGETIPVERLTTENFKIRWYVLKYENSDGWHIDGVLVAKQAELVIKKTFMGDDDAIKQAEQDFTISVNHIETDEDGNETECNDYILSLMQGMSETGEGRTGYYSYDENTHTYTWIIIGRQNREYIVKENNYTVDTDKYNHTNRYKIENSDDEMDDWATYNPLTGVTVTGISYPSDTPYSAVQTVEFQNMYVKSGLLTVSKVDSNTKNGIKNVSFKLSRVDSTSLNLWKKPGKAEYSTDDSAVNDGYTQKVTDNTVTTDSNGNFYIQLAIDKIGQDYEEYYLEEEIPLGYAGPKKIKVRVSNDGVIEMLSTVESSSDDTTEGWIDGENTSHLIIKNRSKLFTEVKIEKNWTGTSQANIKPVKIELWRNGAKLAGSAYTQTLSSSNNWTYTWDNLPVFIDGDTAKYEAKEVSIGDSSYDPDIDEDGYLDYMVSYDAPLYKEGADGTYDDEVYWLDDDGVKHFADHAYLKINNQEVSGKIAFSKTDEATGAPLANAQFTLYEDEACTKVIASQTSNDEGFVVFDSKPAGTYYLRETSAPEGFELNENIFKVTVSGGIATITIKDDDTNTPISVIQNARSKSNLLFSFYKVNEKEEALPGAKFGVYKLVCKNPAHNHSNSLISVDKNGDVSASDSSCWELVAKCESASDDGKVIFDGLNSAYNYRLVEYESPSYYKLPSGQWRIKYNDDEEKFIPVAVGTVSSTPAFENIKGDVPYRLANYPLRDLPTSGDVGVTRYAMAGFALISAGIILLAILKRKKKSK